MSVCCGADSMVRVNAIACVLPQHALGLYEQF